MIPPEITTGVIYGATTGAAIICFNLYANSREKGKDQFQTVVYKEFDKIAASFKSLDYGKVTSNIASLTVQLKTFIQFNHEVLQKQHGNIEKLFEYKEKVSDQILEMQKEFYKQGERPANKPHKKYDILLLEDNKMAQDTMYDNLTERYGHSITRASTIQDALGLLDSQFFDCAIADYCIGQDTSDAFINECLKRNKLVKNTNGKKSAKVLIYTGKNNIKLPAGTMSIEKPYIKWPRFQEMIEWVAE